MSLHYNNTKKLYASIRDYLMHDNKISLDFTSIVYLSLEEFIRYNHSNVEGKTSLNLAN